MHSRLIKILFALVVAYAGTASCAATQQPQERLLVIGDSLSRGLYASSEQHTFRYLVTERLDMESRYLPACHTSDALESWRAWDWQPDMVLLEIGIHGLESHDKNWSHEYGVLLDELLASGARVVVGTVPWCNWGCDGAYFKYQLAMERNVAIRSEASERGLRVADLWAATLCCGDCISQPSESSPFAPGFQGDGFHPGDYGHEVIASSFVEAIEQKQRFFLPLVSKGG